ncbi:MAG: prepilin-type N-terminal cleavage/methylation domain-containing protein [Candidatus Marinamargulisbacteria bacterium]
MEKWAYPLVGGYFILISYIVSIFRVNAARVKFPSRGFTLIELTATMAIVTMIGAITGIALNAHLKDAEEYSHIANAQQAAGAALNLILRERRRPGSGASLTLTFQYLYDDTQLNFVVDPSSGESELLYNPLESMVIIENQPPTGNHPGALKYYIRLVDYSGTYQYIDETDLTDPERVDAKHLSREDVKIPKRNATGH